MLDAKQLHPYQKKAALHQLYNDRSMLWLDMGLGKTVITLSTIEHRIRSGQVKKVLIFGPVRVIHGVWAREAAKWSHTQHLRFSVVHGTPRQRSAALHVDADVYLCNYENMAWLAQYLLDWYVEPEAPFPFQMVVYDEITKVKKSTSKRIAGGEKTIKAKYKPSAFAGSLSLKKLRDKYTCSNDDLVRSGHAICTAEEAIVRYPGWRRVMHLFPFTTGLTGTPAPNGYLDLHGQFLVIDNGERLGTHITHYKESYFMQDYMGWSWTVSELGARMIESKIADITIKMDAADYLDLPPVTVNNVMVDIPDEQRLRYAEIEKEMFTRLDTGTEVEVFNRSAVANKCLQFCNGAVYTDTELKTWEPVHDAKLDALEDIIEEAGGEPVLLAYNFVPDAKRIMDRFKSIKPVNIADVKPKDMPKLLDRWARKEIPLLIGHPASMGHGTDGLQDGGHIMVMYGLNWDLELYLQFRKRLDRQGQTKPVMLHQILCRDSYDLVVLDAIRHKASTETDLKASIDRYRSGSLRGDGELSFI